MAEEKGLLLVISGPAGSGKGSVLANVVNDGGYSYSVSATTRKPRPGELDGVNYHFLTKEQFEEHIANGDFVEYAEYVGNYYGTLYSEIKGKTDEGINVILELEVQGAENVKKMFPDSVLIWILPPDYSTLESRLKGRGTESDDVVAKRMQTALKELEKFELYDYVITNETGKLEEASETLKAIVTAERHKVSRTNDFVKKFLN